MTALQIAKANNYSGLQAMHDNCDLEEVAVYPEYAKINQMSVAELNEFVRTFETSDGEKFDLVMMYANSILGPLLSE